MNGSTQPIKIVATSPFDSLAQELARQMDGQRQGAQRSREAGGPAVYLGGFSGGQEFPDLDRAQAFLEDCRRHPVQRLVWLSSAAVYSPGAHHPGLAAESYPLSERRANRIAVGWRAFEAAARGCFESPRPPASALTVLRPPPVILDGGADYFNRLLSAKVAVVPVGYDPPMQFCSPFDLARAVLAALRGPRSGFRIYNLAPRGVIPLREALRLAGVKRLPVPSIVQSPVRSALSALTRQPSAPQLDYLRHNWTVSGERIRRELGFVARDSSYGSLLGSSLGKTSGEIASSGGKESPTSQVRAGREPLFDDFGMAPEFIAKLGRTVFRFLRRRYWRIECRGLQNLPSRGAALLVGVHRGIVPFDGMMILDASMEACGRAPRFLIHPGLIKPPFFASLFTKLGGLIACRENAERILRDREILGVFPEGVRGAFTPYREAYQLHKFDLSFVRLALRFRAPIVPFVTVGSAETFPILANLRWKWWMRRMDWPCFPLGPNFPWLPLPSKWHTDILPPVEPSGSAADPETVRKVGEEVRRRMEDAMQSMLERRTSWFRGTVFEAEP